MSDKKPTISCYMVVKNAIRLGYPFIEAIKSALPICDEFIIVDGYSDDQTYEYLEKLKNLDPRIKLYRDRWQEVSVRGSAIRNALNLARYRATKDYIMEIDANEIISPENVDIIKSLPVIFPQREMFAFSYYQILGSKILFMEDYRYRLAKNIPEIRALHDGFTLGFRYQGTQWIKRENIRRILNGLLPILLQDRIRREKPEEFIYLPKPIFRYYSLFPDSFFEKMHSKTSFQPTRDYSVFNKNNDLFGKIWDMYEATGDYYQFWDEIYAHFDTLKERGISLNKEMVEKRILEEDYQPEIMKQIFGKRKYVPMDSLSA